MRLRRCELSTPGSNEKMIERALGTKADVVFLDLEDAVAPNQKVEARGKVIDALKTLDWGKKTRAFRMNNIETEYAYEDVIEVVEKAGEHLDVIIIPKVKAARDVFWVDTLLTQIESRAQAQAQDRARSPDRRGRGADQRRRDRDGRRRGSKRSSSARAISARRRACGWARRSAVRSPRYPGDIWHYARSKIVVAARAAGIDAIDGPYADFHNPDGYREEATRSATMGFAGKWAIHPSQIELANEIYSPTPEEVDRARKLEAAYAKAEAEGLGAVTFDGVMIDAASVRMIRNVIDKANLIGM